ncbi:MAG TPA: TIM-barrel domain-containing protein [Lachnospiraceae bacterium]|nr:TIM-barrel domain-containing protein [Lachnospiraceae bacterium]
MSKIKQVSNGLLFTRRDEIILISPYGKNCFRVRATRNTMFSEEKWTLLDPEEVPVSFNEVSDDCQEISNGQLKARIEKSWAGCFISFYNNDKLILRTHDESDAVTKYTHTEGDNYATRVIFDGQPDEHIFGLGQEQQDYFDKKGCSYDLMHWNTKSTIPVIYSSLGYGFLWNNPSPGHVEFSNNRTVWKSDSCYQADYLVFTGDSPKAIMNTYCKLTGFAPQLPHWSTGFWQCKCRYESQEELMDVVHEYKKRGIPIDVIVVDFFHWTEQGNCDMDPKYWPDPKGMCKELRSLGITPIISYWPTINPASRNWQTMDDNNYLIRTENGQYGTFDFWGQQTYVDMTNPDARKYVWEQISKTYIKYGFKSFWLDEAEPEVHPQQFSNLKFHIGNGAQTALVYPYYLQKCFYDGLKSLDNEDPVLLTRCAYPGSQKFGALVWNGDIPSNFDALRQSVVSSLSMAMSGIPWWNSDIGGFFNGDTETDYFRELIVRWFQFGLFCPVMRLHGTRLKQSDYVSKYPGIICDGGGYNEIWKFGEKSYNIIKNIIELRETMRPYIEKCSKNTSITGEPIMRPMFFDYPADSECYKLDDQYMFGENILFAPIVKQGQTEREVYLPEGEWIRTSTKETLSGKTTITAHAEIDEFIAFVRKGADVINIF